MGDVNDVSADPKNLSALDESSSKLAEEVTCVGDDKDESTDPKNLTACDESPLKLAEEVRCVRDDKNVSADPKHLSACDGIPLKLAEEVRCIEDDQDESVESKNLSAGNESPSRLEKEDDGEDAKEEDEDVDFNPFLKETLSPEASSSLSSEVDGLDGDAVESSLAQFHSLLIDSNGRNGDGESEHDDEEVIMRTTLSTERVRENDYVEIVEAEQGSEAAQEKENGLGSGIDFNDDVRGDPSIMTDIPKTAIDLDTEDAICTRTRARYSLASFSLDELENFLQETDDEDDLQNVDDEEEYRKFLTFVLNGSHGDGQSAQDNEVADDDEDNDADFEIELEEALESDDEIQRPQTRQIRRQRSNAQSKKKSSVPTKRPLRPLLPVLPNGSLPMFSSQGGMMPEEPPGNLSSSVQEGFASGFTPHQIGQLHCMIHEHVQLLVQVFCLCSHDSSRQHIASQVQNLIFEMLDKRSEVQAWKNVPYPSTCFFPQYLYPTMSEDVPKLLPMACTLDTNATEEVYPPSNNMSERASTGIYWMPYINSPVTTILDVAPLSLAGKFFKDVAKAVQESRAQSIESRCESRFEKEPLFPLSESQLFTQAFSEVPSSSSQQPRMKSLAATLVENTKKQSIALVPRQITKLAQIFFPFFNPAFYPHKPPPVSVTGRILFTDSEDELLAMGILEYNTDWKAIQHRFLPCKSKHQIFVRQKNRSSSKAQDNSIKAVKRMKNSPLTPEEIASIHEGIKYYKCDWSSVWKHIVPYRDPALLPRQWRLALGTQKSYKLNSGAKEKRRLYEKKKKGEHSGSASEQNKEVEKTDAGNSNAEESAGKTYVHEAFLADWGPVDSNGNSLSAVQAHLGNSQQIMHQNPSFHIPGIRQPTQPNGLPLKQTPNAFKPQFYMPRYRAPKPYGKNMVKLAPGLPPVNLPPSVRIVSESAFRGSHHAALFPVPPAMQRSPMPKGNWQTTRLRETSERRIIDTHTEESETSKEKRIEGDERNNDSDLQMHPLLFQSLEDSHLPYYQLNSSASGSGSFSFFPGNQPQLNLTLLHTPHQENQVGLPGSLQSTESTSLSKGIDFHPFLQRSDYSQLQYIPNTDPRNTAKNTRNANEPDLEFHLSSMSRKERSLGGSEEKASKGAKSSSNAQDLEFIEDNQTNDSLFARHSGGSLPNSSEFGSGDRSPVLPADYVHGYLNDIGDLSNPGIVMEQEELSDSDEENEENVEFECEEITDSEGDEGSGCEQINDVQIEEVSDPAHDKPITEREPRNRSHSRGKPSDRPSLELGLRSQGKGKDETKNSSWLRLDSVSTAGKEDQDATSNPDPGTKSLASSRPTRSCKKKSLNAEVEERRTVDKSRKNGPVLPRKPRKRARKNDDSLNIELNVQNRNCNDDDNVS